MSQQIARQLRQDYLSGDGIFGRFLCQYTEEIKRLKFFLDTMEEFVKTSEQQEVAAHEQRIQGLTPSQKDEYWQWHYPIHWQEIFSDRLRSAFIMHLCSFVEGELNEIAERVRVIAHAPISMRDLTGTTLSKPRKFIEAFGRFKDPANESWELLERIFDVRNVLVHEGGFAGHRHRQKIIDFSGKAPGLSLENFHVHVGRAFCEFSLQTVSEFCDSLHRAYETFRIEAHARECTSGGNV